MTEVILDALRVAAEYMQHQTRCPQSHSPQKSSVCDCGYREAESAITTAIAAREAEGWQPIETAPKLPENAYGEGPTIILLNGFKSYGKPTVRTGYWRGRRTQDWCDTALGRVPSAPTHWRPLPPPPEVAP